MSVALSHKPRYNVYISIVQIFMLVLEAKLKGHSTQYEKLDEAIRTALFVRNSALRYWMDNKGTSRNDLQKLCAILAQEFDWARKLNSQARQSSADRAWLSIERFYKNCKSNQAGKKGYPKFKKRGHSVEYKTTGWKLSEDKKYITFTDGFKTGRFKLKGSCDLNFYQLSQIKRVRVVRRADGYYVQFCVDVERTEPLEATGNVIGIDLGLKTFYIDSNGNSVENPRYLRKSEKALKRLQRKVSKKKKGSSNRKKAIQRLARKHLKISRQRKDFAVKTARALVQSNDMVFYENLQVRNMVKNHKLAKSISDAAWSLTVEWIVYFAKVFRRLEKAVHAPGTTIDCSDCGHPVYKTLSTRTHVCLNCGSVKCRDYNAAINILNRGLNTLGHSEIEAWGQNDLYLGEETSLDKLAG